jgi:pimeloyl-ACP methyl ester carboxylesterase
MEPILLSQGFALAGSAYRENGWAVREGIEDTLALRELFAREVGRPKRTILWGLSLGSMVAQKSVEEMPRVYDGAVCACPPGAGASRSWDKILDLVLAYDVVLGWPKTWGSVREVAPDIDYERDVVPVVVRHLQEKNWLGRFEFVRLIFGAGPEDFYKPPVGHPALLDLMFFATEGRAEIQKRAGGPVGQNLDRRYDLPPEAKAYLASLDVDADALLSRMNARNNFAPDPTATAYLARNADFTGRIQVPVLTLHTVVDGLVLPAHESAYRGTVRRAGREGFLLQVFADGVGHCHFTEAQLIAAVKAMDSWLATGRRPPSDAFPSKDGFVKDFHPPAWLP